MLRAGILVKLYDQYVEYQLDEDEGGGTGGLPAGQMRDINSIARDIQKAVEYLQEWGAVKFLFRSKCYDGFLEIEGRKEISPTP